MSTSRVASAELTLSQAASNPSRSTPRVISSQWACQSTVRLKPPALSAVVLGTGPTGVGLRSVTLAPWTGWFCSSSTRPSTLIVAAGAGAGVGASGVGASGVGALSPQPDTVRTSKPSSADRLAFERRTARVGREIRRVNARRIAVLFGTAIPLAGSGSEERSDSRQVPSLSAPRAGGGSTEPHANRTWVVETATYRESPAGMSEAGAYADYASAARWGPGAARSDAGERHVRRRRATAGAAEIPRRARRC
jgi:hypothetical protein